MESSSKMILLHFIHQGKVNLFSSFLGFSVKDLKRFPSIKTMSNSELLNPLTDLTMVLQNTASYGFNFLKTKRDSVKKIH